MTATSAQRTHLLLNASILAFGALLLVLLYALVARSLSPSSDPAAALLAQESGDIIQVEIRNGCGQAGVARVVGQFLRSRGVDVLDMGNHTNFDEPYSRVVDRVDDLPAAMQIARVLGIDTSRVTQAIDLEAYLDASVILGHDYQSLIPFLQQSAE